MASVNDRGLRAAQKRMLWLAYLAETEQGTFKTLVDALRELTPEALDALRITLLFEIDEHKAGRRPFDIQDHEVVLAGIKDLQYEREA